MNKPRKIQLPSQQSGFALIVGLVVLVLLTLIMLTALKMASLEERMAGNLRSENIAFQAAESALREAENLITASAEGLVDWGNDGNPFRPLDLFTGPFQESASPVCNAGLCQRSERVCVDGDCTLTPPFPASIRGLDAEEVRLASLGIAGIDEPAYVIEMLPIDWSTDERRRYVTFRITAIASGEDPNSLVQLQSTYRAHIVSFTD